MRIRVIVEEFIPPKCIEKRATERVFDEAQFNSIHPLVFHQEIVDAVQETKELIRNAVSGAS